MGVNSAFTLRRDSNRQFDQTYRPGVERTSFRTCYTQLLIGGPYFRILLGDLRSTGRQFWVHGGLLMFALWVVMPRSSAPSCHGCVRRSFAVAVLHVCQSPNRRAIIFAIPISRPNR